MFCVVPISMFPSQVELDQRTGSSMSNKDADLDGWGGGEKESEQPATPNYLTSTNSYLYPETFTGIPLKIVSYKRLHFWFICK